MTTTEERFASADAVALYEDRIEDPELFPQEAEVVDRYFAVGSGRVLDVGCGVGRVSHLLDERGFDVVGIDVSEPLLEAARSRFPDLQFRYEDARDTSFADRSFDYVVFSYYGLDYVLPKAERRAALRELFRVIRPGGIFAFSSHNAWYKPHRRIVGTVIDRYVRGREAVSVRSRVELEDAPVGELPTYYSDPLYQWRELRDVGFSLRAVVGKRDGVERFFEKDPHYVAERPADSD